MEYWIQNMNNSFNMKYVWTISLVAAMGGLLFGYDWVVIGGAKPFFERYFQLNNNEFASGWANSCALIGCFFGALIAGALSDRFGRKKLLILCALLFTITSIGNGLAPTFTVFVCWRICGGVAIGLASSLSPMYIAEVAPARIRGRLVSVNQLTIVIGILLAQFINNALASGMQKGIGEEVLTQSWYVQTGWRWMFGLTAVPSLLFFISMFAIPESPRWMVKNGAQDRAQSVLTKIGGQEYAESALADINSTLANEFQKVNYRDLLEPRMRKVLLIGIILAVFQQWCGINVIFNYADKIFLAAGYDISDVLMNIVWTGSVNFAFTLVAMGIVDRGGRKPLMLFGSAGLTVIYILMGFCYFSGIQGMTMLLLVLAAIACYAMSLAPVTWVVISEIFPNRIRGAAMSICVFALWVACFILTLTFPVLNHRLGPAYTFLIYAAICAVGFVYIFLRLPETKGKTLEQIERELTD
jgi:MFS transporter, SP family, xylose:H+ symportor